MKPNKYRVIGLMSGTSLDGLDVAYCEFEFKKIWRFNILSATTYPYSQEWRKKLAEAHQLSGESLLQLHAEYGKFSGKCCIGFISQHKIARVDFIASHGHTVFHQPEKKFTFQLGDGLSLHAVTGLPVVYDFRALDVALGGEGAPLVPVGDKFLFSQYDVCLNLGGIANLSMDIRGKRKAFDVCFCNMALNYLMNRIDKTFDEDGKKAAAGKINANLLTTITRSYSTDRQPPSLSREIFEKQLQPLLTNKAFPVEDSLRTVCESVAEELLKVIPRSKRKRKLLVTGGGALNIFLIDLLTEKLRDRIEVIVPHRPIIEFKEALVFAFLGVLRVRNEINVLSGVTRARRNSCSGVRVGF